MTLAVLPASNFSCLQPYAQQLVRLGMLSERYFAEDPNTCLLKLRQFGEGLAQHVASRVGSYTSSQEAQIDLIRRLQDLGFLPREIAQLFSELRRAGNAANHALAGDHRLALSTMKVAWQLGVWAHRTFEDASFRSGPFIPPASPQDETQALQEELEALRAALDSHRSAHQKATVRLVAAETQLQETVEERAFWEQMALEAEQAKTEVERALTAAQLSAASQPKVVASYVKAAREAASKLYLDEADTRRLIDSQLRQAGWEADSIELTHKRGARPMKGKNLAIAEWPTQAGRADYVLFLGEMPIGIVEAKRKNTDVSAALQQSLRYSRGFNLGPDMASPGGPWSQCSVPFLFSSNGRPYLQQLETLSGVWFRDVRRSENLAHALNGWYTPDGLSELLKQDHHTAHTQLEKEGFEYQLDLRPYQRDAIRAVETKLAEGEREMLLAMATGTGKTKTCIALIYRLLKVRRFRRVLFLVDRSALGEQAAGAFKETRLESIDTFAEVFGIKELDEISPGPETSVHLATVQGMVKRVLTPSQDAAPPPIDQYDCIVVDECHRGYLLDRELSELELTFRDFEDYVSKYRSVLDHFAAVKIGLTATPALHTSQIFGAPIFTYSYRQAVLDGFLVDYEPVHKIVTELAQNGIEWKVGEEVAVYRPATTQLELFNTPDQIKVDLKDFHRKVITENFNRVVCQVLAKEIDPSGNGKTLIFCATDSHADMVVKLLKEAFAEQYGGVDDDAVVKITGAADKPLQLIRSYKNEKMPNVAVTVDLLTTGIDVPEICTLVFIRKVGSRILFDQMLGRATRRCDAIQKEIFRVFDAAGTFEDLKDLTEMKPVVVNPRIPFTQLLQELSELKGEEERSTVREQLVAKLQGKKRYLTEVACQDIERMTGSSVEELVEFLAKSSVSEVVAFVAKHTGLGEILDRKGQGQGFGVLVSGHDDSLIEVSRRYGDSAKPEDYLAAFKTFLESSGNQIPALVAVLSRPRELTRKQLREVAMELDRAGFTETRLRSAWNDLTNEDIAAGIIGHIRRAALGDPLVPFEQRVQLALQKLLSSRYWTAPQRDWLKRLAAQTLANGLVDREALDDPNLLWRRDGGGFARLNRVFDGEFDKVLETFNETLWQKTA